MPSCHSYFTVVELAKLYRVYAIRLILMKRLGCELFGDQGLCDETFYIHSVFFIDLQAAEKEQESLNENWLAFKIYFVIALIDAVEVLV